MLLHPDTFANPYPLAAHLRETDPVHWNEEFHAWVLTRYADVAASLHDSRFAADRLPELDRLSAMGLESLRPLFSTMRRMLTFLDPPAHGRLRRLANRGFTRPHVESWRSGTQQIVDALLDAAAARGAMDVVHDLAKPLPLAVISAVLGIPPEEHDRLRGWSDAMGRFFGNFTHTAEQLAEVQASIVDFSEYLTGLIAQRRAETLAGADLLSGLVRDAGDAFTEPELLATAILLVGAGTVTTTDLLGNAVLALLRHRERADEVRALPAAPGAIEPAIEELVRYDSPVQMTGRLLTDDVEIGGRRMRRGQWVILWLGAANRDPARFANPDTIDFGRPDVKHLSFGAGAHFCLGAPLARLQAQIAIGTLVRRFPRLQLTGAPLEWERYPTLRGLVSLPVTL